MNHRSDYNFIISIYDRYGKLIQQIKPTKQGWDVTFNGVFATASDY